MEFLLGHQGDDDIAHFRVHSPGLKTLNPREMFHRTSAHCTTEIVESCLWLQNAREKPGADVLCGDGVSDGAMIRVLETKVEGNHIIPISIDNLVCCRLAPVESSVRFDPRFSLLVLTHEYVLCAVWSCYGCPALYVVRY